MKSKADDAVDSLASIRDFVRWGTSQFTEESLFFGHGTDNALDEALFLVLNSLHLPYDLPADYFFSVLTREERKRVTGMIERRISERKPAAYLTREALFAGLPFYVDERVLVPRSPIAELIKQRFERWLEPGQVERVLDLCTGSGCIAIGCAYAFPGAEVDALDISADALEVAEINVRKHDVGDRVHLLQSDLFGQLGEQRYDLIVSNPPYVSGEELDALPDEYHFEPKVGLHGGEFGLDFVQRILEGVAPHLTESGILIVEVGSSAETLQNLYPYVPFYWLEFEHGGDGVFLLTAEQVKVFHQGGR